MRLHINFFLIISVLIKSHLGAKLQNWGGGAKVMEAVDVRVGGISQFKFRK